MKIFIPFLIFFLALVQSLFINSYGVFAQTGEELNNEVNKYYKQGDYENAILYGEKALKQTKVEYGDSSENYATILFNVGSLYCEIGNYSKAEILYLQSLEITKKYFGEDNSDYALSLNNLATLYMETGKFSIAEPLLLKALQIEQKIFGIEHPYYATTIGNLAFIYSEIGDYSKAETMHLQSVEITKKIFGASHPDYAASLKNLAVLYEEMGNYSKAESLLLNALEIQKKVLGEEHKDYGSTLNSLGVLYSHLKNYLKAESFYLQAIEIHKKKLGEEHRDIASSLNNLAVLYKAIGNYSKAEPLYLQAIEIYKKTLGEEHPNYALSLNNLGLLYFEMNNYSKAEQMFLLARNIHLKSIEKNMDFHTEDEMEKYLLYVSSNFAVYKSFFLKYYKEKPEIAKEGLTTEIFSKNLLLRSSSQMRQTILSSDDNEAIKILNDWINVRKILSGQYSKPLVQQVGVDKMEKDAEELEKQLTRISADFRKQKEENKITWQQIQEQISANTATIEFSSFKYFNKGWTDSTVYAAIILKKDATYPEFIFQFEEKQLKKMLSQNNADEVDELNQLYFSSVDSSDLYHLIWQHLEPYLKGVDTIFFSPSGMLHSIDLQAILIPDGKLLGEKYNMVQLSTTRNVITTSGEPDKTSITLFGGIDYDFKPTSKGDSLTNPDYGFHKPDLSIVNRGGTEYFPPLEETKKEIEQIQKQFEANKSQTTLIIGTEATEEAFKSLSGKSPKILHISTHGFFFADIEKKKEDRRIMSFEEDKSVFKISENPLLRSGLIMAHGNYAWKNGNNPYEKEDGILTAYEIANLNLSNTDLVVLSACETGLGEIKGSEGVFGLQRAFKMAGVDYLMMSLWKVPDKETKEFMQVFYSNWLGGLKIRNAFRETQLMMSKTYPNDPYKWAAFVLVE